MSSFGSLLRQLRLTAGLTQEALAERSGLSAKAIGELERNPDRIPRLDTINLVSNALGLHAPDRARLIAAARPVEVDTSASSATSQLRHDLPRVFTPLIGRSGVVEAVASLVRRRENRFVTLTGPGGVGKTRLAIEVADRVADAFVDGVSFVDLSPLRDTSLVLTTIAKQLGVEERGEGSLVERLASVLNSKRFLLVLDNLEHLTGAGEDLLKLLSHSSDLAVLATSRVPLRLRGEREYRVAPLELPPENACLDDLEQSASVALFLDRARAAGIDLSLNDVTSPAVAEICRRLDGLPLALELAAAWVPLLPPVALLERLERRLSLPAVGPPDLPARQRTIRDAIAWSYDLLDPAEQRLFRRLAIFGGDCGLDAATAVCAETGDEHAVLQGLVALMDKNLLRRDEARADFGPPHVVMLETIREYGLERLQESGETERMRARHARFFLDLAESAAPALNGPDQLAWTNLLEQEHDNLRAALAWACDQDDTETGLRFAAALWRFWSIRGHGLEAQRWLVRILTPAVTGNEPQPDEQVTVMALTGAAVLALERGAFDDAAATDRRLPDDRPVTR